MRDFYGAVSIGISKDFGQTALSSLQNFLEETLCSNIQISQLRPDHNTRNCLPYSLQ